MGLISEDELIELQPRVEIGRRVTRYFDQLEYLDHDRDMTRGPHFVRRPTTGSAG